MLLPDIHEMAARGEDHLYQKHCSGGAPTQTLLMEMLHAKRKQFLCYHLRAQHERRVHCHGKYSLTTFLCPLSKSKHGINIILFITELQWHEFVRAGPSKSCHTPQPQHRGEGTPRHTEPHRAARSHRQLEILAAGSHYDNFQRHSKSSSVSEHFILIYNEFSGHFQLCPIDGVWHVQS